MAIAHVCINCGWDQARIRPRREERYGLNLVACPKCESHAVRREHPVWRGWRRGRRTAFGLFVLAARVFITLVLTALHVLASIGLLALWVEVRREGDLPVGMGAFMVLMLGLLALLTGVWLTAGFEHIARWKMWIGWLGWITLILIIVSLHGPLGDDLDPRGEIDDPLSTFWWVIYGFACIVVPGALAAEAILLVALPGIGIGQGILWLARLGRRAGWRKAYRRRHLAKNISWE